MTDTGRERQFSLFYSAHYSLILTAVNRRLNDFPAAQDATAEVFRVAWTHHTGGGELTLAWLYSVVRNVVGNEYRRRSRTDALTQKVKGQSFEPDHQSDEGEAADVRDAMMRLKSSDREILFMAYWEDLSGPEIAAILGCKVPTVWVRMNRARAAMKHELDRQPLRVVGEIKERGEGAYG